MHYPPESATRGYPQNMPYGMYPGYRMPQQQNRMNMYPYPPHMMPPSKEGAGSGDSQPSKPYYPYQMPYGNSWYPQHYMMHPQMMKDR